MKKAILILVCFLTSCATEREVTGYYKSIYTSTTVKETVFIPARYIPYYEKYHERQYYKSFPNPMFIERDKYYDDINKNQGHYNTFYRNDNMMIPFSSYIKKPVLNLERFKTEDKK